MAKKKTDTTSEVITEENMFLKPKYQVIISFIAHFQLNKKNIQRAHLIRALVKNADSSQEQKDVESNKDKKVKKSGEHWYTNRTKIKKQDTDDPNLLEKDILDRLQLLGEERPKIMFNSIANLDKTVKQLRKFGLITNQYVRGYPRIILTDKGRMLFYSCIYSGFIFQTISKIIDKIH